MVYEGTTSNPFAVVQRATKLLQGYRDVLHVAGVRDRVVDSLVGQPQREPAPAFVPPSRSCHKVIWEACMDSAMRAAKCKMLCLLHVGLTQSFMFVLRFFALHWKWVFLDIICEGSTIQSLIALKFCPMGPTIEDSWLEEIWFPKQKFQRCLDSCQVWVHSQ